MLEQTDMSDQEMAEKMGPTETAPKPFACMQQRVFWGISEILLGFRGRQSLSSQPCHERAQGRAGSASNLHTSSAHSLVRSVWIGTLSNITRAILASAKFRCRKSHKCGWIPSRWSALAQPV